MILNHVWGLYSHPIKEWQAIDDRHESLSYSLLHTLVLALIPAVCLYIAAYHLGFRLGNHEYLLLSQQSATTLGIATYVGIVAGILALGALTRAMGSAFGCKTHWRDAYAIASYTATPLLCAGFSALIPIPWFMMCVGLLAVAYSTYLLYNGIPIVMHVPYERGFIYASSVVTAGLVLLVSLMAATVLFWSLLGGLVVVPM